MFLGAGSGELFEDIVRHGSHNIFWCYGFERDVAQYKKIKGNNKTNEMSYTSFYLRRCFTSTQMNIKRDEDGLLPDSRGLLEVHKYVRVPRYFYREPVENQKNCEFWHRDCVVVVPSEKLAKEVAAIIPYIEPCECTEMLERKGIVIGLKEKPVQMHATEKTYLMNFWKEKGVLTESTMPFFVTEIWKIRSLLVRGRRFWIGSHVLVRPDEDIGNEDHVWTWKAKVEDFFVHECQGILEVFFVGKYFEQRLPRENSRMPLVHEMSGMCILNLKPNELSIRPVGQLMYSFMPLPLNPLDDGRRFLLVYELEDSIARRHLLVPGEPGHCPPFPVAGDVMIARAGHGGLHNLVAIRHVVAKHSGESSMDNNLTILEENENLVGKVDVSHLTQRPGSFKFEASLHANATLSWHLLIQRKSNMRPTKVCGGVPVEWQECAQ